MIIFMSVSMFDHKPERCPFGHQLWPDMAQVGWQPCICTAAQEAVERARGMGHLQTVNLSWLAVRWGTVPIA